MGIHLSTDNYCCYNAACPAPDDGLSQACDNNMSQHSGVTLLITTLACSCQCSSQIIRWFYAN